MVNTYNEFPKKRRGQYVLIHDIILKSPFGIPKLFIVFQSFKKGMNQYLTKFKYKNAVTEDLWESLGKASGKPVLDVMTTWTKQMGYPVVKARSLHCRFSVS